MCCPKRSSIAAIAAFCVPSSAPWPPHAPISLATCMSCRTPPTPPTSNAFSLSCPSPALTISTRPSGFDLALVVAEEGVLPGALHLNDALALGGRSLAAQNLEGESLRNGV